LETTAKEQADHLKMLEKAAAGIVKLIETNGKEVAPPG